MIDSFYNKIIFRFSRLTLFILLSITLTMLFFAVQLKIDASSDTLILEKDKDLKYFQLLNKRYKSPDFLIIAYRPNNNLLSSEVKDNIRNLTSDLKKLDKVDTVNSILNVPLLESSRKSLADVLEGVPTLEDSNIDESLIINEFTNSELYKNNLVSEDFKTTAILINLKENTKLTKLREERSKFHELLEKRRLSLEEKKVYEKLSKLLDKERDKQRDSQTKLITEVREIIKEYNNTGELFLGGIPMIANDVVALALKIIFKFFRI